jgi:hypothetical protein
MGMKIKTLYHWKGVLSILVAFSTPFGAWGMGESSLRAAIALGVIAGLTASYNWIDSTLAEAKAKRGRLSLPASTEPTA